MLIDLTKQTFETFTVIKRVENSPNSRNSRWLCQCKLCKKEFVRYSDALRKGGKCSCCNKKGQKHEWCWKGHEEISGKYWSKLKKCALERDIEFNITIEDGWKQFIKQNRKCALTGEELCFVRVYSDNQINQSASLDRIDSSQPYTTSNIQWVHKDINRLKINFQESEFIRLCHSVVYPDFNQIGKRFQRKNTIRSRTWKGYGEISGSYWQKLKRANSKRKKKIDFTVTIEKGWDQFVKQNRRCAITGQQLMFVSDYSRGSSQTASLDRIDSNGHYEIGNVQWVHKDINRLKNDYSEEIFFSLCLKIVQFNESKNSLNLT